MRYELTNLTGNADDILYSEGVAEILGITVHTLHKRADIGRAPKPAAKEGRRNVYLRGDVWEHMRAANDEARPAGRCRAHGCRGTATVGRRGLCPRHRHAYEVLGDRALRLELPPRPRGATLAEKLAALTITDPTTGCHVWVGGRTSDGYGTVSVDGRTVAAHRAAFLSTHGRDIAPELEPDHECGNRACIRVGPGHVTEVTKALNISRMVERVRLRRLAEQEVYATGALTLESDLEERLGSCDAPRAAA